MQYTTLPTTNLQVSKICLGTMSYGHQVSEEAAHKQMDLALSMGVNFFDTAEMYPVPPRAETYGLTETIIGNWLQKTGHREKIILASKVVGPMRYSYIRGGNTRLDRKNIESALEASLRRLQTDVIDLYQLHWPDRNVNTFGERGYTHNENENATAIEETLEVLADIHKSGKVRYFGISNESPWGTLEFLRIAKEKGYPRMVTVQNVYNLLNRTYEIHMSEVSHRENIGLLAYSPLGFGVLGGQYLQGNMPKNGRFALHPNFAARYRTPQVERVTEMYVHLSQKYNLSPAQMALAFVNTRSFVTSNIIGASTLQQLKEDIESIDVELPKELRTELHAIYETFPDPCA